MSRKILCQRLQESSVWAPIPCRDYMNRVKANPATTTCRGPDASTRPKHRHEEGLASLDCMVSGDRSNRATDSQVRSYARGPLGNPFHYGSLNFFNGRISLWCGTHVEPFVTFPALIGLEPP